MPKDSPSIQLLAPDVLVPHPQNPRGKVTKDDVKDLVPVIEVHGQKQPCLVRPDGVGPGKYQILIGHRRAMVGEVLGRPVPCIVASLADDEALAVMLADNPSHVAPDPLRESEAVAAFLGRPGWTLQSVAEALGKSPRWVAQRANLQNLSARVRPLLAAPRCPLSRWPVAWLERLATISAEDQERFVEELDPKGNAYCWRRLERAESLESLDKELAEYTNKLGKAPWKLDDPTLLPVAGACTACPKQSGAKPGLFGDDQGKADPKTDVCLDGACWKKKLQAHVNRKGAELKEKHGDLVAIDGEYSYDTYRQPKLPVPKGVKKLPEHAVTEAKKGDKGAVAALVVSGKGKGTVKWVKVKKEAKNKGTDGKPVLSAEAKAAAAKQEIVERRGHHVCREFANLLVKTPVPPGDEGVAKVLLLTRLYGSGEGQLQEHYQPEKRDKFRKAAVKGMDGILVEAARLWEASRDYIAQAFESDYGDPSTSEAKELAEVLGIDFAALEAAALKEIPDPKPVGEITQKTAKGKKPHKDQHAAAVEDAKKRKAAKAEENHHGAAGCFKSAPGRKQCRFLDGHGGRCREVGKDGEWFIPENGALASDEGNERVDPEQATDLTGGEEE